MTHSMKLISLYYEVCEMYNHYCHKNVLRHNHNGQHGIITDEELLTIYLFCTIEEEKRSKKAMYKYILNHWHSRFPALPSYATFNDRMNRLLSVFPEMLTQLLSELSIPTLSKKGTVRGFFSYYHLLR